MASRQPCHAPHPRYGLCHTLAKFHTARLLADSAWCAAFAAAAAHCARHGAAASPPASSVVASADGSGGGVGTARVCVLGLGSGVPALAAARVGAEVLWVERVERLAEVARRLVTANGLEGRVTVARCREWEDADSMPADGRRRFDAVSTP